MRVRVLYFAGARDIALCSEEQRELPSDVGTIADFTRFIAEVHAGLASRMSSIRIARNERFATADERIEEGDVLAIIPPVAGG